jgi:hypothetical protein
MGHVPGEHKQKVNNTKYCYEHTLRNTQWAVKPSPPPPPILLIPKDSVIWTMFNYNGNSSDY